MKKIIRFLFGKKSDIPNIDKTPKALRPKSERMSDFSKLSVSLFLGLSVFLLFGVLFAQAQSIIIDRDMDFGGARRILNLPGPTLGGHPATKTYVDNEVANATVSELPAGAVTPGGFGTAFTLGNYWFRNTSNTLDVLRIDAGSTRIGIGTATPGYTLDVSGDVRFTGTLQGGSVPWARLTSFPSACPGGQFVTGVGGSLTCATPSYPVTSVFGRTGAVTAAVGDYSSWFFRSDTSNSVDVRLAPGDGRGMRFWDSDNYKVWMSSIGNATWGGRLDGTSDYNMYFQMVAGTNRGFVFRAGGSHPGSPVAQIDAGGNLRFTGSLLQGSVPWAQLTGIPSFASRWPAWDEVTSKPSTFPPSAHSHSAGEITSGTLGIVRGGTGAASFTSGNVLIGAGTNPITTLSRSGIDTRSTFPPSAHSHSAGEITSGTLGIVRGGTGADTAAGARTNLGATTVGSNLFTLTNPSAVRFLRINLDNTISVLDAASFRTAIGAGTGDGTITGVTAGTGLTGGGTSGNVTLSFSESYGDGRYGRLASANVWTAGQTVTPLANSTTLFRVNNSAGTVVFNVDTTNQRVGIGTTSPQYNLDVGTGSIRTTNLYGFNDLNIGLSGANIYLDNAPGVIRFSTVENEALRINENRNVGIGTTNPSVKLHVNETSTSKSGAIINTQATSSSYYALNVQSAGTSRFYVRSDGNVGIGTTSPQGTLHLQKEGGVFARWTNPTASTPGGSANTDWKGGGAAGSDPFTGTEPWYDPTYALSNTASAAYSYGPFFGGYNTHYLKITNFGFNIPGDAIIVGIEARVRKRAYDDWESQVEDSSIRLRKGSSYVGTTKAVYAAWPLSALTYTYGGVSDLWGTTWTPAEINSSDFGIGISASYWFYNEAYVEYVEIRVHYTIPPGTTESSWIAGVRSDGKYVIATGGNENNPVVVLGSDGSSNLMGESVMYLRRAYNLSYPYNIPAYCPTDWTQADAQQEYAAAGTNTNYVRTCFRCP